MAKLGQTVDVPIQFFVTITTSEAADHDAAAREVREQVETQIRDVFRPGLERLAALEAEREKFRAVVLAVAEACDVAGRGVSVNHVGVFADLGRAVDSALGIDGETWAGSGRALRALAGAS